MRFMSVSLDVLSMNLLPRFCKPGRETPLNQALKGSLDSETCCVKTFVWTTGKGGNQAWSGADC
jgi:hypothetical protein